MRKRANVDWRLTSCCGVRKVRIAGILRCGKCEREVIQHDERQSTGHMWDTHDQNYRRGEDE